MIEKETGEVILDPDGAQLKVLTSNDTWSDKKMFSLFTFRNFLCLIACLQNAKAEFTYAFDSINKDVICCHSVGRFSRKEFLVCMEKCKQVSQSIFDYYRKIIKKYANTI